MNSIILPSPAVHNIQQIVVRWPADNHKAFFTYKMEDDRRILHRYLASEDGQRTLRLAMAQLAGMPYVLRSKSNG